MPIVIFEGCDLSGKSTAIEKISKKLNSGFVLKNCFKPKTDDAMIYYQYESIIASIMTYLDRQPNEVVILDRFYPSEAVYSYLRGYDALNSEFIKTMDTMCNGLNVRLILIETPLKELERRYMFRGDENVDVKDLETLKSRYDEFFKNSKLDKIRVNTMDENWETETIKFIRGDLT